MGLGEVRRDHVKIVISFKSLDVIYYFVQSADKTSTPIHKLN